MGIVVSSEAEIESAAAYPYPERWEKLFKATTLQFAVLRHPPFAGKSLFEQWGEKMKHDASGASPRSE